MYIFNNECILCVINFYENFHCILLIFYRYVPDIQGGGSDVVSVACFGVRVSMMFHLMFVHYTFSSVWVAEWPPFGK